MRVGRAIDVQSGVIGFGRPWAAVARANERDVEAGSIPMRGAVASCMCLASRPTQMIFSLP